MEPQPKKRGRKKKIQNTEPKEPINKLDLIPIVDISQNEPVKIQDVVFKTNMIIEKQETRKIGRKEKTRALYQCAEKVENIMNSAVFLKSFRKKLFANKPCDYILGLGGKYSDYIGKYELIKKELQDQSNLLYWSDVLSFEMAKMLSTIISFLLENGPMSKIEEDIFDSCIDLIKKYYSERLSLVTLSNKNSEYFKKTSYCPKSDTNVYKFLFDILSIPLVNEGYKDVHPAI